MVLLLSGKGLYRSQWCDASLHVDVSMCRLSRQSPLVDREWYRWQQVTLSVQGGQMHLGPKPLRGRLILIVPVFP